MLKEIATVTKGKYYRAKNNKELESIYYDISKLEKSRITTTGFSKKYEFYQPFLLIGLIALLLELFLKNTILRKIP